LDSLFSSRVSQRMPSHSDRKYNYPYEPKSVDPDRKVKRVRHKDVFRRLCFVPREVVRLNQKVTNALVNMVNHHLAFRDSELPQPAERIGCWEISPVHPQPCIKDHSREGSRLRSSHQKRLSGPTSCQPLYADTQVRTRPQYPCPKPGASPKTF
jgi:hypothetical protein